MHNRVTQFPELSATGGQSPGRIRRPMLASWISRIAKWLLPVLVFGCASYSGSSLKSGSSSLEDVVAVMGVPALKWTNPDRSVQLSYPRGPEGFHSYMVYVDAGGRLERIENVMDGAAFAKVKAAMTKEDVLRLLGPSVPEWSIYFPARRELAWEWRYCNGRSTSARFHVLFDNDTGRVRSTMAIDDNCMEGGCLCAN